MPLQFRKNIFMMPDGDANAGGTATETPAPTAAPASEDNSNGNSPTPSSAPGLLADAPTGDNDGAPATETPGSDVLPDGSLPGDRPDYFPKHYWNEEKGEGNTEELAKGYNNLRAELNKVNQEKGTGAPETAEAYLEDYQPPHRTRPATGEKEGEVMDRYGSLDPKDPVFVAMAKFAKQGNMSPAAFTDGMQELLETLHPLLPEVFNPEKEKGILGEGAENMIKTNRDWIDTLARNGVINEDEFNLLLGFGANALGVQLTNKLRLNSGEKPIPVDLNGPANQGRKTPAECQAMMADERYHQEGPVGDAYRAEVDKAFAETHGTEKV